MAETEAASGAEEHGETLQIGPSTDTEQPKDKKKLFIIGGVVLVLLLVIIAVALIVLMPADENTIGVRGTEEEAEFVDQYNKRMQVTLEPIVEPLFTKPFSFTVNMKNGMNYIHLRFRAQMKDPNAIAFLESREPVIDDKLINLLRNKMPQDIKTRTGLDELKQEIFIELNTMFPQEFIDQSLSKDRMPVKDILIMEYFIQ